MALGRDQILGIRANPPRQTVEVTELGGSVTIRSLSLREVEDFQAAQKKHQEDPLKLYPLIVVMGTINDDGSPLFSEGDSGVVAELPWSAVDTIARAVMKFNKMMGDEPGPKA